VKLAITEPTKEAKGNPLLPKKNLKPPSYPPPSRD
jgi:hypothetical protein